MPARLVDDCQRCNAKSITFNGSGGSPVKDNIDADLMPDFELFYMCRNCYSFIYFP